MNKDEMLIGLTAAWQKAKEMRKAAEIEQHQLEHKIYELVQDDLKKGVNKLATGMKITTGETIDWDQQQLKNIANEFKVFPFIPTWKPDGRAITALAKDDPDAYKLLMSCAATVKVKKPQFTMGADDAE